MDLTPLYRATADGRPREYLQAHPDLLTTEAAQACRADFEAAAGAGRADVAWVAAMAASFILLAIGDGHASLDSRLDAVQVMFMVADDAAAYDAAREDALGIAALAAPVGASVVAFRSLVVAADCAFFAVQLTPDDALILRALDDVGTAAAAAAGLTDDPDQGGWMARLASLIGAVVSEATERVWTGGTDDHVDVALRRVAAGAQNLPLEMSFDGIGGDAKAAQVASALAELDARYGSGE